MTKSAKLSLQRKKSLKSRQISSFKNQEWQSFVENKGKKKNRAIINEPCVALDCASQSNYRLATRLHNILPVFMHGRYFRIGARN